MPLLGLPVLVVLRDEGPEIVDFLFVLDAGKYHLGAGDFRLRILDVVLEFGLVPGDAGTLVGIRVGIIRRGAGLAAVQPVKLRADLVPGAFADGMTGDAFVEGGLAGGDVLRECRGRGCRRDDDDQRALCRFLHGVLFVFRGGLQPLWHGVCAVDKPPNASGFHRSRRHCRMTGIPGPSILWSPTQSDPDVLDSA